MLKEYREPLIDDKTPFARSHNHKGLRAIKAILLADNYGFNTIIV